MNNEHDFDDILYLDDPEFSKKFAAAIGAHDGDTIQLRTPQFTRTDGEVPAIPDGLWHSLGSFPRETLKAIGCCAWDEPDSEGKVLMLFPGEWYPYLPAGLVITDINGETEPFKPGVTDADIRFGCLAYGVVV